MKKMILLGALMLSAAAGYSQESRQDISVSGFDLIGPTVVGNAVYLKPSTTLGVLASYRYLLTPRSALELNYSFGSEHQLLSVLRKRHPQSHQDAPAGA